MCTGGGWVEGGTSQVRTLIYPQLLVAPVPSVSHSTHMYTSCDSIVVVCSGSVIQTPPTHSDPPVPTVDLSNIPDDGTLGE